MSNTRGDPNNRAVDLSKFAKMWWSLQNHLKGENCEIDEHLV